MEDEPLRRAWWRAVDEWCHARFQVGRKPDPEVQAERFSHLGREVAAQRGAGHAFDEFTDQESVGHRVIAMGAAGLPQRALCREGLDDRFAAEDVVEAQPSVQCGQPTAMRQGLVDRQRLFACLRELGPVVGDWPVDVQLAAFDQQGRAERGGPLGRREHQLERVCGERRPCTSVPPHRSTAVRPLWRTQSAAPVPVRWTRVASKAWRTPVKPGAVLPPI